MRKASAGLRVLLLLVPTVLSGCGGEQARGKPNVVLIVVDTLRGDVLLEGERRVSTPGIDRLVRDGVAFSAAFSHAPMTLPSHTSLFASRPPFETGVLNNWQQVGADLPLLAEWLGEYGYATRAVVSLGTLNPVNRSGLDRGFEQFDLDFWHIDQAPAVLERLRAPLDALDANEPSFLFAHFCDPHEPYNSHGAVQRTAELRIDGEPSEELVTSDMTTAELELELSAGRHTIEILSEHTFLLPAFQIWRGKERLEPEWEAGEAHSRQTSVRVAFEAEADGTYLLRLRINDAPERKEIRGRYAAEVGFVDRAVEELLDALDERGLYDSSLILFTSDHGEALGEHGAIGHVQNLHDEMIHVPLIVKLPEGDSREAALRDNADRLVSHQEVVPTILELIGLPPLEGQRGASLLEPVEVLLIAETHKPEARRDLICLRDERHKLVYDPEADEFEMYDMVADPEELKNVFQERGSELEEWVERLRAIALVAKTGGLGEVDAETRELLKGLGYAH